MSLHKDPELKEAVLNLPEKEKDKLLVRLIGKDTMLMKQLHFQLLEDESDLTYRIDKLRQKLLDLLSPYRLKALNTPNNRNYKELTTILRYASGLINEHEKITKDKFSEVEFRLMILNLPLKECPTLFDKSTLFYYGADKLHLYIKSKLKTTLTKYYKLHEDLQYDLHLLYDNVFSFGIENNLIDN